MPVGDSPGANPPVTVQANPTTVEDRWILSRLQRAQAEFSVRIDAYDFSHAALGLYAFIYGELCDWYLELIKPRLRAGDQALSATLLYVLTETVALAHPIIPFVTEEIYSHIPGAEGLLAAGIADQAQPVTDEAAEATVGRLIEAVQALRAWRDLTGVKARAIVPARLAASGYEDTAEHLARLTRFSFEDSTPADGSTSIVPVPHGSVEILASDDVDLGAAQRKLDDKRAKVQIEIERAQRKLANAGFVAKAPADVVRAERDKLAQLQAELGA